MNQRHFCGAVIALVFAVSASATDRVLLPPLLLQNHNPHDPNTRFTLANGRFHASYATNEIRLGVGKTTIRLRFAGANPAVRVDAIGPAPGRVNLLTGNDPAGWVTDLQMYSGVVYRNLYPGIDMTWRPHAGGVKTEFLVAPGADVTAIRMSYSGVKYIHVDDFGALVLGTGDSQIRDEPPRVYTERNGVRKPVGAAYFVGARGIVAFRVDPYDRRAALVIDPVLSYSTLLSGSGHDSATSVAVDQNGNAYIAGWTESTDFPVTGGLTRGTGVDMFVAKFTPANTLAWCTFIGGSGDDRALAIAVDASGLAVIAGSTTSSDMPLISPFQVASHGGSDVFIAKLNATGTALVFSTYFGGSATDTASGVALDSGGNIYVAGSTTSKDFPTANAFQPTNNGQQNAFIFKLNAAGTTLGYSTLIGGSNMDGATAIAVDSSGAAYITGSTQSTNFPIRNALQGALHGTETAFVTKVDPTGRALLYSTFLGGSGGTWITPENGAAIALDATGAAYVAGVTSSADFPVAGAYQSIYAGNTDAFVAKLNPAGNALVYSTYFGGSSHDWATGIAVDASGAVSFCGYTSSDDFPTLHAIQSSNAGIYDAFVAHLGPSGALLSSTYLGGSSLDAANGIAVDGSGNAFVAGQTMSGNFPLVAPLYAANKDNYTAFFAKLSLTSTPAGTLALRMPVLQFPDGSMGVWYFGGTGRQLPLTGFTFLSGPSSGIQLENVADLNGDGMPDLILRFSDGSIGVWYLGGPQGTTITGFAFISGPIQGWVPVTMADLNGDGHPDLIIQNTDQSVAVWYLGGTQGNQIQNFALISGPLGGWKVVGTADLDNDGHPDIILQYTDGSIGAWYMAGAQGTQIKSFSLIANPSSWSVVGATDMDADGHPDLMIRNTDGTLGVWYLGGTQGRQITGFTPITGPGNTTWRELVTH